MSEDTRGPWSAPPAGVEEDFSSFLDFHDVDLTFHDGDHVDASGDVQQDEMDVGGGSFGRDLDTSQLSTPVSTAFPSGDSLVDIAMQQRAFNQQMQQEHGRPGSGMQTHSLRSTQGQRHTYFRHGMVPPTPNSVEMHGAQVHAFTDPQALGIYETGKHQDHMVFTPLVSPAFQLHDFSTSGEYFSPLTSPALQAQDYTHIPASFPSGGEVGEKRDVSNVHTMARKTKRRSTTSAKDPVHAVRSSPAMKARQKRHSGGGKTPKEVAEIVAGLGSVQQASPGLGANDRASALRSQANSETGSISPEPLSEVLMPPPAAPRSSNYGKPGQSSAGDASTGTSLGNAPATPASLFRRSRPEVPSEDAMTSNSLLSPSADAQSSGLQIHESVATSPGALANVRASNGAPAGTIVSSSVTREVTASTNHALVSGIATKEVNHQGRTVKKRNGSSHVSPALRPRISPSIKPLLPGLATYDSDATAALLANKSNYERIIDGSASQLGVNFPAQLSENLTSKRTSHKLAEQGRRNRINTALTEIQALLPEGFGRDHSETPNTPSGTVPGGSTGASKAKTVENAIGFIRALQNELTGVNSALAARDAELAAAYLEIRQLKGEISEETGKESSESRYKLPDASR